MPEDTTIPCSFQARDAVRNAKPDKVSYSEFLASVFGGGERENRETEGY